MIDNQRQNLHEKAKNLRVEPSDRIWNRLEKRLDQDAGKMKVSTFRRWMAIAASVLLIVSILFLSKISPADHSGGLVIVDLEPMPAASYASYQYASQFNAIYEQQGWRGFTEGSKKRLKSRLHEGNNRLSAPGMDTLREGSL